MRPTLELLAAAAVSALLTIGYVVYAGRQLGPAEYSQFSAALSFIYFFAIVLSPLTPAVARVVARRMAHDDLPAVAGIRRQMLRALAIGALAIAAILFVPVVYLSRLLRFESPVPLLLAFAAALFFAVLSAERGLLQGMARFRAYNVSVIAEAAIRFGIAYLLMQTAGKTAAHLIVAYIAGIVAAELMIMATQTHATPLPTELWPELRRFMLPMVVLMVAAAIYQNTDMMAVKRWFPAVEAGQYGAAVALAKMFGVIFMPFYALIGPVLTHHHEREEPLTAPALRITAMFAGVSALALVALFGLADEIVAVLFGPAFVPSAWVAPHLGTVSVLIHASILLAQIFITLHDFRFLRFFVIAAALQVGGLVIFHETIAGVLACLYVAQIVLIVPLILRLARQSRAAGTW